MLLLFWPSVGLCQPPLAGLGGPLQMKTAHFPLLYLALCIWWSRDNKKGVAYWPLLSHLCHEPFLLFLTIGTIIYIPLCFTLAIHLFNHFYASACPLTACSSYHLTSFCRVDQYSSFWQFWWSACHRGFSQCRCLQHQPINLHSSKNVITAVEFKSSFEFRRQLVFTWFKDGSINLLVFPSSSYYMRGTLNVFDIHIADCSLTWTWRFVCHRHHRFGSPWRLPGQ
jgi:hypothetical protein